MSSTPTAGLRPPGVGQRLHQALMPDYNRRATVYWWTVFVLGVGVLTYALGWTLQQPALTQAQILFGCAVSMLAGMYPVRIPGSKNAFVGGEVFIMLLLLMQGPEAAVLAAAGEAFVGSARISKRWTSRLVSPAAAALSMFAAGSALTALVSWIDPGGAIGGALVLLATTGLALAHFSLNTVLITLVVHLKSDQPLRLRALAVGFGWVGATYAASALTAGLLFTSFQRSGVAVMIVAVPIIIVLLIMLHYHFRQRESDDAAQRLRVEAAEREAAQSARHVAELRDSERRFHSAFAHAAIGMALVSTDGRIVQANPALCSLLGRSEDELKTIDFKDCVHEDDVGLLTRQWVDLLGGRDCESHVELRCLCAGERIVHAALHSAYFDQRDADAPSLIVQLRDITSHREVEAQLQQIAYHDGLTALANRVRFGTVLSQALERGRQDPSFRFALMYLDFDRFKLINDTLGHAAGDHFLSIAARRIRDHVRPNDTVGRLGGDEFAILVEGAVDDAGITAMADRLLVSLAAPYELEGNEINSSASIGITFSSLGYQTPGDMLRDADIAMYRAKAAGRGRAVRFDASLRARLATQVGLERDLRRAIDQEQLSLVFQPIFDLDSGRVDSFEALARWTHPLRGPVSPAVFIPIAEESALIGRLTDWVLAKACEHLKAIQASRVGQPKPRLHLNVSGTDMCRASFVSQVATVLLVNGLEPGQLTLEITESTLMQRLDAALEVMGKLREIGVGLSVDDFGTGYSSLAYLTTLPITSLKIDRSFVQRLQENGKDTEVVRAVLTLGRSLGKSVIAEGVETLEQLAALRGLGCVLGQGFLMARPLSAEHAAATMRFDLTAAREAGNAPVLEAQPGAWAANLH